MILTPKTIQIFLPGGDPRGIRVAEITTRIVQVIEVPRSLLQDFVKMPESEQVALYFLFGEEEDTAAPMVYIGQTGDLRQRLINHNKNKAFWQRANSHLTNAQYDPDPCPVSRMALPSNGATSGAVQSRERQQRHEATYTCAT